MELQALRELFQGKKTYIVLGLAAAVWFAEQSQMIAPGSFTAARPLFELLGGATLVAKFNRFGGL